jgi:hypothetical protein
VRGTIQRHICSAMVLANHTYPIAWPLRKLRIVHHLYSRPTQTVSPPAEYTPLFAVLIIRRAVLSRSYTVPTLHRARAAYLSCCTSHPPLHHLFHHPSPSSVMPPVTSPHRAISLAITITTTRYTDTAHTLSTLYTYAAYTSFACAARTLHRRFAHTLGLHCTCAAYELRPRCTQPAKTLHPPDHTLHIYHTLYPSRCVHITPLHHWDIASLGGCGASVYICNTLHRAILSPTAPQLYPAAHTSCAVNHCWTALHQVICSPVRRHNLHYTSPHYPISCGSAKQITAPHWAALRFASCCSTPNPRLHPTLFCPATQCDTPQYLPLS